MAVVARAGNARKVAVVTALAIAAVLGGTGTAQAATTTTTPAAPPASTRPASEQPTSSAPATSEPTPTTTTAPTTTPTTPATPSTTAPSTAAAVPLSVVVTPATNLAPGQTVAVDVAGLGTSQYAYLLECLVGDAGESCRYLAFLDVGPTGTAHAEVSVSRHIGDSSASVDCASAACEVRAVTDTGSAGAPIAFDPAAPIPPGPPLLIGPAGPYADGGVVLVAGSGFTPDDLLQVVECRASVGSDCWRNGSPDIGVSLGAFGTGEDGRLFVGLRLARLVSGFDCAGAPGACELRVFSRSDLDRVSVLPLAFDPSLPVGPQPTVTITPSTALRDGQVVRVLATHFMPGTDLYLRQCTTGGDEDCRGFDVGTTSRAGALAQNITLRRLVGGRDCASVSCFLLVTSTTGAETVEVPLAYDASIPPPPPPTLTVTPSTELVDLQSVTVRGEHLGAGYVLVEQCARGGAPCRSVGNGSVAADGTYTAGLAVRRVLHDSSGDHDCAAAPGDCILRLQAYDDGSVVLDAPLTFDPAVPPARPALRVVPASGLVDRQSVHLIGSGFDPAEALSVGECAGDPPDPFPATAPSNCVVLREYALNPDATGHIDQRLQVRRTIDATDGSTHDCARTRCTLVVAGQSDRVVVPIAFARRGPSETSAFPAQLPCVAWPTTAWPTGPLPDGVDPAVLDRVANDALVEESSVDSILVVHGGRLVFERYRAGKGPDTINHSFSMAKSMTSSIIGMLIEEGRVALDGPAPVPEWADPSDPRHAISIRNLLNMSSGLQWREDYYDASSDVIQMLAYSGKADMAHYAASKPLAVEPGTRWQYSTGDSMILAGIIARTVGSGPTLDAFLHQRLFDPIGMGPMELGFDDAGTWIGGARADTTSRSFAKFGLLYLRGGSWGGRKVLADGWAEYARTPAPTTDGYGAQFWLGGLPGSFNAIGFLGQQIEIVPELDLVVVINSSNGNTVDVSAINDQFAKAAPPGCATMTATDDAASVRPGSTAAIGVLANDRSTGSSIEARSLVVLQLPHLGTARVDGRRIRYRAPRGVSGTDTFTYEVCNRQGDCDRATVTVQVG